MENLFQLLIFLFIVYSIVSALSGKKKTKATDEQEDTNKTGDVNTSPNNSTGDILEDLFGIKLPKTGNEYPKQKPASSPFNRKPEDVSIVEGEPVPEDPSLKVAGKVITVEQSKAYDTSFSFNQRTVTLKKKIKNPETIKEFLLISEILNKPKALRK
jgi:hypothetical protein